MTDYVFLGPSIPREVAQGMHQAEYLPPVAMGDVFRLVRDRCKRGDRIALIDGLFEQVPSVWHKEILFALERGYPVYGASSMGALRAAELLPFGMTGVGRVFECYRDGRIEDDDEVAVSHAPAEQGFRSLSTAMVSIRLALGDAVSEGSLDPALADALIEGAKEQPYFRRNWGDLIAQAKMMGADEQTCETLRILAKKPDAKAEDAAELLTGLANGRSFEHPPEMLEFNNTTFWQGLVSDISTDWSGTKERGDFSRADENLAAFIRAAGPDRDEIIDLALLDRLVEVFAADFVPSKQDILLAAKRLLNRSSKFAGGNGEDASVGAIDVDELQAQAALDARRTWLVSQFAPSLDSHILRRFKRRGDFGDFAERVAHILAKLRHNGQLKAPLAESGTEISQIEGWYRERFGPLAPHPEEHAKNLGFQGLRDFVDHLTIVYLAETEGHLEASFKSATPALGETE